jgi:hypothetical protein
VRAVGPVEPVAPLSAVAAVRERRALAPPSLAASAAAGPIASTVPSARTLIVDRARTQPKDSHGDGVDSPGGEEREGQRATM